VERWDTTFPTILISTNIVRESELSSLSLCTPSLSLSLSLSVFVHYTWKLRCWMKKCWLSSAAAIKRLQNGVHRATCLYSFVRRRASISLRHVCLSICPSVCPSVRPALHVEQLGSHWADLREIWYLNIFRTSVKNIQVSLKSEVKRFYFTRRTIYSFHHTSMSLISSYNEICFRWKLWRKSKHTFYV